jgi:hypothetical protein
MSSLSCSTNSLALVNYCYFERHFEPFPHWRVQATRWSLQPSLSLRLFLFVGCCLDLIVELVHSPPVGFEEFEREYQDIVASSNNIRCSETAVIDDEGTEAMSLED